MAFPFVQRDEFPVDVQRTPVLWFGSQALGDQPDIETPAAGYYGIYVGRFKEDEPITGTLTVTTDPTLTPAVLAPAASAQQ